MSDWCQGQPLADFGNTVVCVDTDQKKIQKLQDGGIPIFEPGLDDSFSRFRVEL
jgi:UDPglucose 6-dehydrogenase